MTSHQLLLDDEFYDEIFRELGIPYEPVRWRTDHPDSIDDKSARVIELIAAYRNRGHLMADIDPLRLDKTRFRSHLDLDVHSHGLTLWDLDREFKVGGFAGAEYKKLRDVLGLLRDSYCRHVGVEYTHILEPEQQNWLRERVEVKHDKPTVAEQKYILSKLNAAEAFESFLATKYVGQKRFSLQGAEAVIPMMDAVLDQAAEHGLDEVVIGMPHRGRLNVLANIVGKPYSQIFSEFEGNLDPSQAQGCLPTVFQAVEIDGVPHWDGGYMGNPALFPLFGETTTDDILLVQINPVERRQTPRTAREIHDRLNEISFNSTLVRELRAVAFVKQLIEEGKLSPDDYKNVHLHRIDASGVLDVHEASSKGKAEWDYFVQLRDDGRHTAQSWLAAHYGAIGVRGTLDLQSVRL